MLLLIFVSSALTIAGLIKVGGIDGLVSSVPADYWDWFCLLGVNCQGHRVDIIYDRTGRHYGRGKGLQLIIDGKARRIKPKNKL